MDVAGLSMALAQTETLNNIGTAVLSKSLDAMEASGAQMVDMMKSSMELSVNPNLGANIDIYL